MSIANLISDIEALRDRFENAHWGQDLRDVASAVTELASHVHAMAQHLAQTAAPVLNEAAADAKEVADETKGVAAKIGAELESHA